MCYVQFDYFKVNETKLHNSFLSAQYILSDYELKARIERWSMGVVVASMLQEVSFIKV